MDHSDGYTYGFDHQALNVPEAQAHNCYAGYEPLNDRLGLTNAYMPPPLMEPTEPTGEVEFNRRYRNNPSANMTQRVIDTGMQEFEHASTSTGRLLPRHNKTSGWAPDDDEHAYLRVTAGLTPTQLLLASAYCRVEPPYTGPLTMCEPRFVEPSALAAERAIQAEMQLMAQGTGEAKNVTIKVTPEKKGPGARQKAAIIATPAKPKPRARANPKRATAAPKRNVK